MNQEDLKREWIELAPAWIREAREGVNITRTGLLDRPMLEACGNVEGLKILDSCMFSMICWVMTVGRKRFSVCSVQP